MIMKVPHTYSEWVTLLERFGDGDDTVLELFNKGSYTLDGGTADRFFNSVEAAYKKRKKAWLENFQKSFHFQPAKSENELEIILNIGKQNLIPLVKFVQAEGIHEKIRDLLREDLESFTSEIKKSLKDNTSKVGNAKEKMLLLVNGFALPTVINTSFAEAKNQHEYPEIQSSGRKIIF